MLKINESYMNKILCECKYKHPQYTQITDARLVRKYEKP